MSESIGEPQKEDKKHDEQNYQKVPFYSHDELISTIQIYVKDLSGKIFTFDAEEYDTIEALKEKILIQTGIPTEDQLLEFNQNELKNWQKLSECGIIAESTINLI